MRILCNAFWLYSPLFLHIHDLHPPFPTHTIFFNSPSTINAVNISWYVLSIRRCWHIQGCTIGENQLFLHNYQLQQLLRVGWRFLPTPILHDRILSSLRRSFKHCLNFQESIYRIASLCPENTVPLISTSISSLTIIPHSLLSWSLTLEWKEFIVDVPLGAGHSTSSYSLYLYQCVHLYWSLYTAKGRVSGESCLMY